VIGFGPVWLRRVDEILWIVTLNLNGYAVEVQGRIVSYDLVFVTTQHSVREMIGKQAVHFMLWISAISPHISPHIPTVTARGRLWRVGHAHGLGGQASSSAGQPDPQPKRDSPFSLPLTLAGATGMKAHNPRPM
jgi:hypothetical protein